MMNGDLNKKIKSIDKSTLEAAKRGDTNTVLKKLNESDRKKLEELLSDKEKLNSLLNSSAAKKLKKILEGNQDG